MLVNNAAMMTFDPIESLAEALGDRVLDVNLRAPFRCHDAASRTWVQAAVIVNVSSAHAAETMADVVPYATSKGALEAFAGDLASDIAF